MSFLDDLAEARQKTSNRSCKTCSWLMEQPKEHRAGFDGWLVDKLSKLELWRICRENGLPAGKTNFYDHLRECCKP
jgi:hypothetical protein